MAKQVVIPQDLGDEFAVGTDIPNKITVRTDGSTLQKNTSGQLEVNTANLGIPTVPGSYNDENIVVSGLPAPVASATNAEDALTGLANAVSANAATEELENTFSNVKLGYIKPQQ